MGFKILAKNLGPELLRDLQSLLEDTVFSLVSDGGLPDWRDPSSINKYFGRRPPKVVLNSLPEDFSQIDASYQAEVDALTEVCASRAIPLFQLSSYRVFGDTYLDKGLREVDLPQPDDRIGKSILNVERAVAGAKEHIILRAGWLLEGQHTGVLEKFIPPMLAREDLFVSDHRYGSPLPCRFLAKSIFAMIQQLTCGAQNWGVFHLHSGDKCSEAEFADQLVRLLTHEFKLQIRTPTVANVGDDRHVMSGCAHLLGRRSTANFGIQLPTWRSGFARVAKSWLEATKVREDLQVKGTSDSDVL